MTLAALTARLSRWRPLPALPVARPRLRWSPGHVMVAAVAALALPSFALAVADLLRAG